MSSRKLRSVVRLRVLALAATLAVVAYLAWAATIPYPPTPLSFTSDPGTWSGAFHVHTRDSDGSGTIEDVARAAKATGVAWVLVADHNALPSQPYRDVDGVLMVFAPEISALDGHVTTLGLSRLPTRPERKATNALANLRKLGGVPVASHPLARKRPYTRLDDPDLGGLEVLSTDQEGREALRDPRRIVPAALAYLVNPMHAVAVLVRRPEATFARWDQLLASRRMPGFCSIDAHGIPPYDVLMRLLQMYAVVGRPRAGDPAADGAALTAALLHGRSFCGVDVYGGAGGFRFAAVSGTRAVGMGDDVALADHPVLQLDLAYTALPPEAHPVVTCGGREMPTRAAAAPTGRRFEAIPTRPGACRAEVRLGRPGDAGARPWIVSNPIYIR